MLFLIGIIKGKYIGGLEAVTFRILYVSADTGTFGDSGQVTVELVVAVQLVAGTDGIAKTQFL